MNKFRFLSLILVAALIGACGGGSGDPTFGTGTGGGGGGGGEPPSCADEPTNPDCIPVVNPPIVVLLGSGVGGTFQESVIEVGVANLSAGGQTNLEVTLVLESDTSTFYDDEFVTVSFTSNCVEAGLATISPASVATGTGTATATYIAQGCATTDLITASAVVGGAPLTDALGTVTVAPADVNAIGFIGANPELIGLQGTGGLGFDETSDVTFSVVDAQGDPVAGVDVSFVLDSTVGGITLSPDSATSDAQGNVTVVVTSGTVATTVRVTASVDVGGQMISTQSSGLVISTGLPDQNSFSWAITCPNIEAWDYNGVENQITVQLADRFNNPVPDGTAISFTAEGGSIQPNCQTTSSGTQSGFCTVTWASANPRPADGRVTVLATATGEETFYDENGNGVFDPADATWDDIPEVFRDDDENGIYESGVGNDAFFFDYDNSQSYSVADGEFNGILCADPGRCEGPDKIGIGAAGVIVMSGSAAVIVDDVGGDLDISGGFGSVTFTIGDSRGQPMPAGTTVRFQPNNGELVGEDTITTLCTSANSPLEYRFAVNADDTPNAAQGILSVTTPRGITTPYFITVTD